METPPTLTPEIVAAMDAADRYLAEPLGVEDLARAAGLSRFHFSRTFQTATGETPAAFVERLRLERAALLLLAGEIPITELAWEIGFRNPETFARRFRARYGVTARDYRRHQLELFGRLGLAPGEDPGGPGGEIEITDLPGLEVAFLRSLGPDEGFDFDRTVEPWSSLEALSPVLVGRTLDAPGITPPERLRTDRGALVDPAVPSAPSLSRGRLGRGVHATIEVPGNRPVPNRVYQRLYLWGLDGRHRIAPGPVVEICHHDRIVDCQPVREFMGGAAWFPSTGSRSTVR